MGKMFVSRFICSVLFPKANFSTGIDFALAKKQNLRPAGKKKNLNFHLLEKLLEARENLL